MTDLALHPNNTPALPAFAPSIDPTGGRLVAWAEGLAAAHRIGTALCRTAFAPKHFAGKPEDAAAAILFGDEIGLTPTQALRSIHVISGTPGLYARAMVALVQAKGHDIWTELDTPTKVAVCGQRRGSNRVERSEWTTDRARKAGYTANKKYETDPQAMLYARAASDVCRKVAADALAGLAYTVEEMELEEQPATVTLTRADTPKRTARRAPAPAPAEPELDEPVAESALEPQTEPEQSDLISDAQSKMLHTLMGKAGMTDRALGLAFCTDTTGREVGSTKDLTKTEASAVIDALMAVSQPEIPDA